VPLLGEAFAGPILNAIAIITCSQRQALNEQCGGFRTLIPSQKHLYYWALSPMCGLRENRGAGWTALSYNLELS